MLTRNLVNKFIRIWAVLKEKFISQSKVYVVQPKNETCLKDIKQRDGEAIRSYLARFNAVVAAIHQPNERLSIWLLFQDSI